MQLLSPISRRSASKWARRFVQAAADFVFPPSCRLCDRELPEAALDQAGPLFCADCHTALTVSHGRACLRCGASIGPHLDPTRPCTYCRNDRFIFERVIRLAVYDGAIRKACLEAKQPGGEPLAAALGELTYSSEAAAFTAAKIDIVVPVPQFWRQRFVRPHHAAETLAHVWARRLHVPMGSHILRKQRWTQPQSRLQPSQRRSNLRRAFVAVGPERLSGATVLLADDVMTTGTTAQEAARQLRQAGAAHVIVAVVARGLGRR
ncbi:MAG: ComF family protein [Planctomycetaceae bacterium]|nr:ComF family protein [Planctomycetaceae bacterium]